MRVINIGEKTYVIKRSFKSDGWFGKAIEELGPTEIAIGYKVDKVLKSNDGYYHIVNEIKDVTPIDE